MVVARARVFAGKKASSSTCVEDEPGEDTEGEQLQEAEEDSGQKEPGPEASRLGEQENIEGEQEAPSHLDGNKNADADQYYGEKPPGSKITMYCTYLYYSADGCQRGAFCTFAHPAEDIDTEWIDRRRGAMRPMVVCKFFQQGFVV